jgi:predicted 3-demethylubiquinone-9 3-methyltransferase (glyoxalase superfamily)
MSISALPGLAIGQNENKSPLNIADLFKSQQKHPAEMEKTETPEPRAKRFDQASMSAASMQRYQAAYQYSNTMSMQLTTKEGDQVMVDFRQLYAQYQELNRQQAMEEGPKGVRYFESREAMEMTAFEERFGISVQGDLNEEELGAIFDVFEQVDQLANTFYNGDIEKAFEQAMELQVDFGQIQSFSLDMTRTEMRAVSYQQGAVAQYQQVQNPQQAQEKPGVKDLPPYLQAWQSAIERLDEQFAEAQKMFDEMMADTLAQRFPEQDSKEGWFERVKNLHQELSGLLDLNAPTPQQASANESVANPEEVQSA